MILLVPNVGESVGEPYGYVCGELIYVGEITLCKILRGEMLETRKISFRWGTVLTAPWLTSSFSKSANIGHSESVRGGLF